MRSAKEIRNGLEAKKEQKYQNLMSIQEKIIEDAMKVGDHSRLFVFTDRDYFNGIEREWYNELFDRAVKEMKAAGYKLSGICVMCD